MQLKPVYKNHIERSLELVNIDPTRQHRKLFGYATETCFFKNFFLIIQTVDLNRTQAGALLCRFYGHNNQ